MNGKPSLKEACLGHVNHLNFGGHQPYSLERLIISGADRAVNLGGRSMWQTGDGLGHQFITLTVDICVQHGGPDALHASLESVSNSGDL